MFNCFQLLSTAFNHLLQITSEESLRLTSTEKGDKDFEFDCVFAPTEGQDRVFDEVRGRAGA